MKRSYRIARRILHRLFRLIDVQWIHAERVPVTGGIIVAPNHKSYFDPPMAAIGVEREMSFFAKAELFGVPVLGRLIRELNSIPVRRGEADRQSIAAAISCVREGGSLVMFPEGTRSKTEAFLEPKLGVGMIAARAESPVVPVYIHGTRGNLLRTVLSSLVRRRKIRVIYGEPLMLSSPATQRSDRYREMAEQVMVSIAALKAELEEAS